MGVTKHRTIWASPTKWLTLTSGFCIFFTSTTWTSGFCVFFTSTETAALEMGNPGCSPQLSHSFWALNNGAVMLPLFTFRFQSGLHGCIKIYLRYKSMTPCIWFFFFFNVVVSINVLQVAARLIAHAGSLTNLAKYPASTVQILGAEKALFRYVVFRGCGCVFSPHLSVYWWRFWTFVSRLE